MEDTALRRVKLTIRISGSGDYVGNKTPFPYVYISDALSQNILYHCYEKPKTVEELSKLCGVPSYYIEDALSNLITREAVSEPHKGYFRTEFVILSDKISAYEQKNRAMFDRITEDFIAALKELAKKTEKLGIYTAGKSSDALLYLYGVLVLEHFGYAKNLNPYSEYPVKYDGNRWCYRGYTQEYTSKTFGRECSMNLGSRGHYSHISYRFNKFAYRRMMLDTEINVCEDILTGADVADKESAAHAIEEEFIKRNSDGTLTVTVPAFTFEQKNVFDNITDEIFACNGDDSIINKYAKTLRAYINGYTELFPTHLKDDAERFGHYMYVAAVDFVYECAQERGLLITPGDGSICDVLIQTKTVK